MTSITEKRVCLAVVAIAATAAIGMLAYVGRWDVAKLAILAIQVAQSDPAHSPDVVVGGKIVKWWEDDYTSPHTRCWGTLLNATGCVMDEERVAPCERRVNALCNWLKPDD
jgi:hypothetical protein